MQELYGSFLEICHSLEGICDFDLELARAELHSDYFSWEVNGISSYIGSYL